MVQLLGTDTQQARKWEQQMQSQVWLLTTLTTSRPLMLARSRIPLVQLLRHP
jgi:hypothetical protein